MLKTIGIATFIRPDCNCGGIEDHIFNVLKNINLKNSKVFLFYAKDPNNEGESDILKRICIPKKVDCLISDRLHLSNGFIKLEFNVRLFFISKKLQLDLFIMNGDNGSFAFASKRLIVQYGSTSINKMRRYISKYSIHSIYRRIVLLFSAFFEIYATSMANYIIVDNGTIIDQVRRWNSRVPIHLIYDAIDTSSFNNLKDKKNIRNKLGLKEDFLYAIWVSTDPTKGLNDAILAIDNLSKTRLIVVGANPPVKSEKIIYLGYIKHNLLNEYYNACDYFILPSRKRAIDLATIDALFCNLPVILYKSAYGFLFRENEALLCKDQEDLNRILKQIEIGKINIEKVSAKRLLPEFDPINVANKYKDVINSLIDN